MMPVDARDGSGNDGTSNAVAATLLPVVEGLVTREAWGGQTPWTQSFLKGAIRDFFAGLQSLDVESIAREMSAQTVFTPEFRSALDGTIEGKLEFLQDQASQEAVRLEIYRGYSPNYRGIGGADPLINITGHRREMVENAINGALAFKVQERLIAPFTVAQLLGVRFDPGKIADFLREPGLVLKDLFRQSVETEVTGSESIFTLIDKIRGKFGAIVSEDEANERILYMSIGRTAFPEEDDRIGVVFNGVRVGSYKKPTDTNSRVLGLLHMYVPSFAVFPTDWKYADSAGSIANFVQRQSGLQ
ncbi:MAG: hypothetical protein WD988_03275 [Candidatus Curtissbacteria bacterium]